MDSIVALINSFQINKTVLHHTAKKKVDYIYKGLSRDQNSIIYSINNTNKYLPIETIICAKKQSEIDRNWFKSNYDDQQKSAPCNFSVIKSILGRKS